MIHLDSNEDNTAQSTHNSDIKVSETHAFEPLRGTDTTKQTPVSYPPKISSCHHKAVSKVSKNRFAHLDTADYFEIDIEPNKHLKILNADLQKSSDKDPEYLHSILKNSNAMNVTPKFPPIATSTNTFPFETKKFNGQLLRRSLLMRHKPLVNIANIAERKTKAISSHEHMLKKATSITIEKQHDSSVKSPSLSTLEPYCKSSSFQLTELSELEEQPQFVLTTDNTNLIIKLSSWMNHPLIKVTRFWDICLPGTHNSASWEITDNADRRWGGVVFSFLKQFIHCQSYNIYRQLQMGIRFLDLRVCKHPRRKEEPYCAHGGFRTVSLKVVLQQIAEFIQSHPTEIIVLSVRRDVAYMHGAASIGIIESDFWVSYYLKAYLGQRLSADVTIGELADRQQNIIYFFEERERFLPVVSSVSIENDNVIPLDKKETHVVVSLKAIWPEGLSTTENVEPLPKITDVAREEIFKQISKENTDSFARKKEEEESPKLSKAILEKCAMEQNQQRRRHSAPENLNRTYSSTIEDAYIINSTSIAMQPTTGRRAVVAVLLPSKIRQTTKRTLGESLPSLATSSFGTSTDRSLRSSIGTFVSKESDSTLEEKQKDENENEPTSMDEDEDIIPIRHQRAFTLWIKENIHKYIKDQQQSKQFSYVSKDSTNAVGEEQEKLQHIHSTMLSDTEKKKKKKKKKIYADIITHKPSKTDIFEQQRPIPLRKKQRKISSSSEPNILRKVLIMDECKKSIKPKNNYDKYLSRYVTYIIQQHNDSPQPKDQRYGVLKDDNKQKDNKSHASLPFCWHRSDSLPFIPGYEKELRRVEHALGLRHYKAVRKSKKLFEKQKQQKKKEKKMENNGTLNDNNFFFRRSHFDISHQLPLKQRGNNNNVRRLMKARHDDDDEEEEDTGLFERQMLKKFPTVTTTKNSKKHFNHRGKSQHNILNFKNVDREDYNDNDSDRSGITAVPAVHTFRRLLSDNNYLSLKHYQQPNKRKSLLHASGSYSDPEKRSFHIAMERSNADFVVGTVSAPITTDAIWSNDEEGMGKDYVRQKTISQCSRAFATPPKRWRASYHKKKQLFVQGRYFKSAFTQHGVVHQKVGVMSGVSVLQRRHSMFAPGYQRLTTRKTIPINKEENGISDKDSTSLPLQHPFIDLLKQKETQLTEKQDNGLDHLSVDVSQNKKKKQERVRKELKKTIPYISSKQQLQFERLRRPSLLTPFVAGKTRITKSWNVTTDPNPKLLCKKLLYWSMTHGALQPRKPFILKVLAAEITPPSLSSHEPSVSLLKFWTVQGASALCMRNNGLQQAALETHKLLLDQVLKRSITNRVNGVTHDFLNEKVVSRLIQLNILTALRLVHGINVSKNYDKATPPIKTQLVEEYDNTDVKHHRVWETLDAYDRPT